MHACPMGRAQAAGSCRLRCGAKPQSALVMGLPGVPLPSFVNAVRLASENVPLRAHSDYSEIVLPVPDQPPRPTVGPC
jgi:hypothetical protein